MVGEPLVVGKIQADNQPDALAAVGFLGLGPLELELHFLVETEGLLPAFDAAARLLRRLLVRPEVEYQIGLRHEYSYSGPGTEKSSGDAAGRCRNYGGHDRFRMGRNCGSSPPLLLLLP